MYRVYAEISLKGFRLKAVLQQSIDFWASPFTTLITLPFFRDSDIDKQKNDCGIVYGQDYGKLGESFR